MVRNDTRTETDATLRTQLRPHAGSRVDSWHALANATVAVALVAALTVSVLALIDAVVSGSASVLAQRSGAQPASQGWRASALQPVLFLPRCTPLESAFCDFD
jgi:hypothetical protein